ENSAVLHKRQELRFLLMTLAASEPSLRYTQGMCSIGRFILEIVRAGQAGSATAPLSPHQMAAAFNLFSAMLRTGSASTHTPCDARPPSATLPGLAPLFSRDMTALRCRLYQADRLIRRRMPTLASHLAHEGIESSSFASSFILTLGSNFTCFPAPLVAQLWDGWCIGGWPAVFNSLLSMLAALQPRLLRAPMEDVLQYLSAPLALSNLFDDVPSFSPGHAGCSAVGDAVTTAELNALETDFWCNAQANVSGRL
ncbi:hypothetical protein EON62_05805, partial [archaeon]